jgi:hypothetical protein
MEMQFKSTASIYNTFRPLVTTPTINIFELLKLNKDNSYEEYELKVANHISHTDMYGRVLPSAEE